MKCKILELFILEHFILELFHQSKKIIEQQGIHI